MSFLSILLLVMAFLYLDNHIKHLREDLDEKKGLSYSKHLSFRLIGALIDHPAIIEASGVNLKNLEIDFKDWDEAARDKWAEFVKSDRVNLKDNNVNFDFVYLPSDDVFVVQKNGSAYACLRRTQGKTYLFDASLVLFPDESSDYPSDELRLSVVLRSFDDPDSNVSHVITVGIKQIGRVHV